MTHSAVTVPLSTLARAVTLIDGLADLDDPSGYPDAVLPGLARLVGADVITFNDIGPGPGPVQYTDYPGGALEPATRAAFARHVGEHPVVNHYRACGDGSALRISDFLGRAEFHRLGLYSEFFAHIPIEHQLAITLSVPDTHIIGIAFNRARTEFSDTDRDLLAVLRAPLVAGLRRARRRHVSRHALAAGSDARLAMLTDREVRVLELAALGRTNTAIGHALDVSPRTVAKHLEHVYRKLGVPNRAAACTAARPGR
jgi:DNA-binding CsgD family transcriptional regulator